MADRCFVNEMPDFIPETAVDKESTAGEDSLKKLLSLPYKKLSEKLKRAAFDLKETVIDPIALFYLYPSSFAC